MLLCGWYSATPTLQSDKLYKMPEVREGEGDISKSAARGLRCNQPRIYPPGLRQRGWSKSETVGGIPYYIK